MKQNLQRKSNDKPEYGCALEVEVKEKAKLGYFVRSNDMSELIVGKEGGRPLVVEEKGRRPFAVKDKAWPQSVHLFTVQQLNGLAEHLGCHRV